MTRPAPRESRKVSIIGNKGPVTPPMAGDQPAAPSGEKAPSKPAEKQSKKAAPKRRQTTIYQTEEQAERMHGAIMATMSSEGPHSISQFIITAAMAEMERLEKKYNGGEPFPPVSAGEFPTGQTYN
ncbi:ParB family protein [Dermabacteraceae bacterium P13115]